MTTAIYGIDWTDGYGIEEAYTSLADAELVIYYHLLETHLNNVAHIRRYNNRETFQVEVNTLANDVDYLHDNGYIEDVVYISTVYLNDTFKP